MPDADRKLKSIAHEYGDEFVRRVKVRLVETMGRGQVQAFTLSDVEKAFQSVSRIDGAFSDVIDMA